MLDLPFNSFSGPLPETLSVLQSVSSFTVEGNHLSEIPGYLAELSLVTLELSQNNFSGSPPDQLWNSTTILEIFLGNNQLGGQIPKGIGKFADLQRLQHENNLFEGHVPSSIGKLKNLTNLSLRGNRLSGEIPYELFDCENLVALDLGMNNLSGSIPKDISRLRLLDNLVQAQNQLSGQIASEICSGFQQVEYPDSEFAQRCGVLDLSHNNLSGEIPLAIKNCTVVKVLQLQGQLVNEDQMVQTLDLEKNQEVVQSHPPWICHILELHHQIAQPPCQVQPLVLLRSIWIQGSMNDTGRF